MGNDYSSLTVAALKEICRERDLSTTGRKAEIIERLLASKKAIANTPDDMEGSISFDEEEDVVESSDDVLVAEKEDNEEILDAEIHDAEVIDDLPEIASAKKQRPATLFEQIQNPKIAVVLITLLLAGSGWYWYSINQLEPFTPDKLRYGDEMSYTITNGNLDVTDEFITILADQFETDEEICRLRVAFSGSGSTVISEGTKNDLVGEEG